MKPGKVFSFFKKAKNLKHKAEELLSAQPQVIVVAADDSSARRVGELLAYPVEHLAFSECENPTGSLLARLEQADAVIIYSRDPLQDLAGLVAALLCVKEATFRYRLLLVGEDSCLVEQVLRTELRVRKAHFVSVVDPLKEQAALARALVLTVPDSALPGLCRSDVLKSAIKHLLPFLLPLMLLKAALVRSLPWGSEFSLEYLAITVVLLEMLRPLPNWASWGIALFFSVSVLRACQMVSLGAVAARLLQLRRR